MSWEYIQCLTNSSPEKISTTGIKYNIYKCQVNINFRGEQSVKPIISTNCALGC